MIQCQLLATDFIESSWIRIKGKTAPNPKKEYMNPIQIRNEAGGNVRHASGPDAFTLTELLVVVAVVTVLFMLLLPALAATHPANEAAQCMQNKKQLMRATQMYAADYGDLLPPNPDDVNNIVGHRWVPGEATGSGPGVSWTKASVLEDERRFLLLPYVKTIKLLKCPADGRIARFEDGTYGPAIRTVSMNGAVGTACASWKNGGSHSGPPKLETRAPHLTGYANDPSYNRYNKLSTIANPNPSKLWVFLDESPMLLNDGSFAFKVTQNTWVDAPGAYHNGACGFAFADGHAEIHKWKSSRTGHFLGSIQNGTPEETDYLWMKARTSAPSN